mmetsp:Transcript_23367/g.22992  ORF Transcript_23367/g.22992 Transcript_23367/m.22992 type:complete len:110 (+) Transcript_23367:1251-1580(+)|eukprot:CAMPEP_0170563914 /NCGR_PEP_ID=MMETSP0211-20121228/69746_1 /TAXON_ID=311385 /ORGANISM="Pseudokeronopsis sp., Strain OXSARD2" /LENGTH=109 /DNA_ID=CAMNT_0010882743 /DNA_START=1184 /DNA_END=1513 /DNA_ORIENTATION=+
MSNLVELQERISEKDLKASVLRRAEQTRLQSANKIKIQKAKQAWVGFENEIDHMQNQIVKKDSKTNFRCQYLEKQMENKIQVKQGVDQIKRELAVSNLYMNKRKEEFIK